MADGLRLTNNFTETRAYHIRIKGHLSADWADWLGGLTITLDEQGETILNSPALDQAALHGLLKKIRDAGLTLISVNPVEKTKKE